MLDFLRRTDSYLMINVYPYYIYMEGNGVEGLDYALFRPLPPNKEAVDSNTTLHYTNVFDAMVDSSFFALADLNFVNVPLVVGETGWPSRGDPNEPVATIDNANTYNSNLVGHVLNNTGTPRHPGIPIKLFNKDEKPSATSEQNWGLFDPENFSPVYTMHQIGAVLANDTSNQIYSIAVDGAESKLLQVALDWACGQGQADCTAINQDQPCYDPDTVQDHTSYAFDAYCQKMDRASESCDFKGMATITTTDPSNLLSLSLKLLFYFFSYHTSIHCIFSSDSILTTQQNMKYWRSLLQ